MKLFQIVRKNFALLGMSSNQSCFNRKSVKTFSLLISAITCNIVFLFFDANTSMEYTMNIFAATTMFAAWINFVAVLFQKEKLFNLMDELDGFLDEQPKNSAMKAIMEKTNRRVENLCEIGHFVIVKITPACVIFPRAIISYGIFITTNAGREAFVLPFLNWYPFDWKNPLGYLIAITLQYMIAVYGLTLVFSCVSFGIECCLLLLSIINKKVKIDLKFINKNASPDRKRVLTFIKIHSFLKRTVDDFLNIFQIPLVAASLWSLVTICMAMLLIQMQIHDHDSMVLILISSNVTYAFGLMFCICEFGQRMSNGFIEIDDEIESFDWYLFPNELQRMLPIILMMTQQPVELKYFGSISATRECAKKIFKAAFSYFSTMRQFI